jgi:exopolysaccharide production protein ExoY
VKTSFASPVSPERTKPRTLHAQLAVKRGFDVIVSVALLTLAAPVLLLAVIAIRRTSTGAAIYAGQRWGLAESHFPCFKLRSMYVNQNELLARLGRPDRDGDGRLLIYPDDPRITPVGAFLRKTSLDELPQLVNVLRGEMSLVGPRPLATYMMDQFPELRAARSVMRPGITGLWQVRRRMKNANVLDMIDDDLEYIRTYSFWLDLMILIRTIPRMLGPDVAEPSADAGGDYRAHGFRSSDVKLSQDERGHGG